MGQILPQLVVLRVHPRGSACPSAPLRFCHLLMETSPDALRVQGARPPHAADSAGSRLHLNKFCFFFPRYKVFPLPAGGWIAALFLDLQTG